MLKTNSFCNHSSINKYDIWGRYIFKPTQIKILTPQCILFQQLCKIRYFGVILYHLTLISFCVFFQWGSHKLPLPVLSSARNGSQTRGTTLCLIASVWTHSEKQQGICCAQFCCVCHISRKRTWTKAIWNIPRWTH